jgi:hypothetical protein
MIERDTETLPQSLRTAVRVLRDGPAPSDLWKHRLLHDIAAAPRPERENGSRTPSRGWVLRPATAIAAGLVCALIGAGSTVAALRVLAERDATIVSQTSAPRRVRFTLVAPSATRVSIVGDFNAWNPAGSPLHRLADGRTWEVEVPLDPGRYAYSFVVDGLLARDPSAPQAKDDDFGSANSVVMVRGS